ncbi:tripartite tricarboxylate transporter TctB family protein [Plantactinospora solaniradicis]|uniref:Tripartite tricarboxylate transporter TctB family protein n=1 Tax=Plantactinospora solaniradicis TaxID=1723736 RepID=A0ABW1K4S1_9ACTN
MSSDADTRGGAVEEVALPPVPWGARILGAVLLAVGLFLLWTAYDSADGDFSPHGPWLAPVVVTIGWVVLAIWYLAVQFGPSSWRSGPDTAEPDTAEPDDVADSDGEPVPAVQWLTPALLCAALLGYVLLLAPVGFVLASAVFFVVCARILGSRHSLRDVAVGVPLAVGVYYGFTLGLDITLPAGVLPL